MDSAAISEVDVSIDIKEVVESSQIVPEEEESSEGTVAGERGFTLVDVSGNEAPVAVGVLVVIFGRESSVGLGRNKVEDADAAGILFHADVTAALCRCMELIDRVWSVAGGDLLILPEGRG